MGVTILLGILLLHSSISYAFIPQPSYIGIRVKSTSIWGPADNGATFLRRLAGVLQIDPSLLSYSQAGLTDPPTRNPTSPTTTNSNNSTSPPKEVILLRIVRISKPPESVSLNEAHEIAIRAVEQCRSSAMIAIGVLSIALDEDGKAEHDQIDNINQLDSSSFTAGTGLSERDIAMLIGFSVAIGVVIIGIICFILWTRWNDSLQNEADNYSLKKMKETDLSKVMVDAAKVDMLDLSDELRREYSTYTNLKREYENIAIRQELKRRPQLKKSWQYRFNKDMHTHFGAPQVTEDEMQQQQQNRGEDIGKEEDLTTL
eukprot:PhF_6_TR4400/c0_g1_i1/m.5943